MAEKKIGDIVIGIIMLLFFVGAYSGLIVSFDSQFSNNEGYGSSLNTISNNITSNYQESDVALQQNLLNGSSFSIPGGSDVDVRGSSQVALISKNSPGTIRNFIDVSTAYLLFNKLITGTLVLLMIALVTIVWLRFFRPGGA